MKYISKKYAKFRSSINKWRDSNRESLESYLSGVVAGMTILMFISMPSILEGINSESRAISEFKRGRKLMYAIYQIKGGNEILNPIYQTLNPKF